MSGRALASVSKKGGGNTKKVHMLLRDIIKKGLMLLLNIIKKVHILLAQREIFEKICKIHNFCATTKFFTYFWGSTKFPIELWVNLVRLVKGTFS